VTKRLGDLPSYPAYKDSGVRWLGTVPEHWPIRRLKYVLRERDSRSESGAEQLLRVSQYTGVTERKQTEGREGPDTRAASLVGYKRVERDDLVVNIMLAWNGSLGVSAFHGITSPAYCVYRFGAHAVPLFFHSLLRSQTYRARIKAVSTGVVDSRLRLYTDDLYRLEVPLPSLLEQCAIARFLTHADWQIRRYIRAKQKLIKLLEEQKQAIIHRAVTRGLDPNVHLKPSGVAWLGDVPEHWSVVPIRRVVEVKDGTHETPSYVDPSDGSVPLVTSKDFGPTSIRFEGAKHISSEDHREIVRRSNSAYGDVLMSMIGGNIGKALIVDSDREFSIKNVALFKTSHLQALAKFVLYYLQSGLLDIQISLLSKGGAQGFLALGQIRNLVFVSMTSSEMSQIVEYLDSTLYTYDELTRGAREGLKLVDEFRTRLVADVMTGKVDVREAAARLAVETDGPLLLDDAGAVSGAIEDEVDDLDTTPEEADA
jgi:type I restriction enzyme S subunit